MTNFIFKSHEDFHKILINQLKVIVSEQRHQRMDLADINRLLHFLVSDKKLQKQVDDYFEDDETSPQTDTENNGSDHS